MTSFTTGQVEVTERQDDRSQLPAEQLRQMYELMALARMLDERMWLLNRGGQAPFVISCQGHEAAQAGAGFALQPGKDILLPYYRDLALSLHFGITPRDVMLSLLGKQGDPTSGGRQMPAHYSSRKLNIITGSSPVATQLPHAVGVALAARIRGEDSVALTCTGEGSTNQGDFHEALNFASVRKLPVIFMVENNGWAISVPQSKQMAVEHVSERAAAYGIAGVTVDGTDPLAVYATMKEAADRARRGDGPTLVEAMVYRFTAHSSDDDDRSYRPQGETQELRAHDPNLRFRTRLIEEGVMTEEDAKKIEVQVKAQVDDATDYAEKAPYPDPSELLLHVYGS
ncbi:MAG TPA: thiamine pyrophosphate-dependent dehydrogenase E1 component subunit alpha [Nitrolancea sp.]|jgi:2-oxoisovalerate dehydrogenase E1 component alpha subunit|nr:thiamine pyrophosphate-dependent dehydrogenase E1 component subunit alpha [Nitrolancea sp.]